MFISDKGADFNVEREKAHNKEKKTKSLRDKTADNLFDSSQPSEITAANLVDDDTVDYDKNVIFDASLPVIPKINNPLDMYKNENSIQDALENEDSVSIKRDNLDCSDNNISKVDTVGILNSHHGKNFTSVKSKRSQQHSVLWPRKSPPDKTKPRKKQTSTSCDICGKQLVNTRMLNKHRIMHHQQEEGTTDCDICAAKFKTQQSLKIHRKRHTEPKYKCEVKLFYFHPSQLKFLDTDDFNMITST